MNNLTTKQRLQHFAKEMGYGRNKFEEFVEIGSGYLSSKSTTITSDIIERVLDKFPDLNLVWLLSGEGDMLTKVEQPKEVAIPIHNINTRPRIPLNAAAGTVSVALSGVTAEDSELLPFITAFSNYNYTILVKGESMEPEFHSGDELACLQVNGKSSFIQWGNFHVLDTMQGVLVKRIYEDGEYILCKSENSLLFKDFKIHKSEIYNIGLVIGMLRRF